MGNSPARPIPKENVVPSGKTRICVAGYNISTYTGLARALAGAIGSRHAAQCETWFYFDKSKHYYDFLHVKFDPVPFPDHLKGHASSPFVWLERANAEGNANTIELLGGATEF